MLKIKINREINIPDSLTCKSCKARKEYDTKSAESRAADCANFNDKVFATKQSGWAFVKCRACIDATLDYLNGRVK